MESLGYVDSWLLADGWRVLWYKGTRYHGFASSIHLEAIVSKDRFGLKDRNSGIDLSLEVT